MNRKILSFLIVITLCLSLVSVTALAVDKSYLSLTPQYGSNGKFLAPIEAPAEGSAPVSTRAQLEAIRDNLEGNYHLTADIDLAGSQWVPIGDENSSFSGTLDGQGHVIRNMTITGEGYEYSGLFGFAPNGTFKNIGMEDINIDINVSGSFINGITVGSLCGVNSWNNSISNCYSSGTVSVDSEESCSVGGLSGTTFGAISNSYNTAAVSAFSSESAAGAGGISGIGGGGSDINNCYNTGKISVSSTSSSAAAAGGICGASTSIRDCFNLGEVSVSSQNAAVGGISGSRIGAGSGINNCYNAGAVFASAAHGDNSNSFSRAGGICGDAGGHPISSCFNIGTVSVSNTSVAYAGGICGNIIASFSLSKCYNAGAVSASATNTVYTGGIAGNMHIMMSISDCYNTGAVTAADASSIKAGGICGHIIGPIDYSYNVGQISAAAAVDRNIGGICGSGEDLNGNAPTSNSNSYCLDLYGSSFGIQLTSAQMKSAASFAGFDFTETWDISPSVNNGYPHLRDEPGDPNQTCTITAIAGNGGTVTGGGTYAQGENVALTATPDRDYIFDGWYENGEILSGIGAVYEFSVIKHRTLEARFIGNWTNPYSDIPADAWFYQGARYTHMNDLMKGTSETTFEPYATLSRGMLATVLYRMEGEPKVSYRNVFSDVPDGQWYSLSIIWANENGIVNGYGNGLFGTNDDITREQLAAMIHRYANYKKYNLSSSSNLAAYTDTGDISPWALDGIRWCVAEKLITGMTDTTLMPGGTTNRAQCATILMRFMENIVLS